MKNNIENIFNEWLKEDAEDFSGVLSASDENGAIYQKAFNFRNKAEKLPNTPETAFALASGTKIFTGLAICKLIDSGKLSPDDLLCNVVKHDLGEIDKSITIFHLLTHTSGVGDYIDEEADDADEKLQALYDKYPVQLWMRLEYYLQMITPLKPKFKPGQRYGYSNSGYILLGLVVEAVSGMPYQKYVHDEILTPCNMTHSGFIRTDSLPANTALGYMQDEDTKKWHTNAFSIPIIGGSDGGIYSCADDFDKLWRAIFSNKLLSKEMTETFLKSHVLIDKDEDDGSIESYGFGIYNTLADEKKIFFVVGGDSGVGFLSGYYPKTQTVVSVFSNIGWQSASILFDDMLDLLG